MNTKDRNFDAPVSIYCDDCGREKMAEIRGTKLVITDRRHGRRHVAVVLLSEFFEKAKSPGNRPNEEPTSG